MEILLVLVPFPWSLIVFWLLISCFLFSIQLIQDFPIVFLFIFFSTFKKKIKKKKACLVLFLMIFSSFEKEKKGKV